MTDTKIVPPRARQRLSEASRKGIITCAHYENGARRDISIDDCGLATLRDTGIVWLGLHEPDDELVQLIQDQFGLHELLIEDVHQAHQRPKLDTYGDVLFLAVRTAQLIDRKIQFGETHLIVGKGYVVAIRHGASVSYATVRTRCERTPQLLRIGESFVLYAILDFITDNYFPVLDEVEDELEQIEEEIFAATPANEKIERIYRLRVELQRMRRVVSPMLEISTRLGRHEFAQASPVIQPYLHDLHDHIQLLNEATLDLRERLASAFEASLLLASARQNDIVKKLASWAAILAVPTAIAGIYGMNFKFMPELDWQFGYPAVMAAIAGTCAFLYYRFKRSSWL
jgi:magnesium transporter